MNGSGKAIGFSHYFGHLFKRLNEDYKGKNKEKNNEAC
jgi:hypothetical protein